MASYSYTDYTGFDPEHGGATPTFSFVADKGVFSSQISEPNEEERHGCDPLETKSEALDHLRQRIEDLCKEINEVAAFMVAAAACIKYENLTEPEEPEEE